MVCVVWNYKSTSQIHRELTLGACPEGSNTSLIDTGVFFRCDIIHLCLPRLDMVLAWTLENKLETIPTSKNICIIFDRETKP